MKNKNVFVVIIALFLTALILYFYYKKPKEENTAMATNDTGTVPEINPIQTISTQGPGSFPLKKGSKGKNVQMLQVLIGVTPDGNWGPKTETAMLKIFKDNLITQPEFAGIISANELSKGFPIVAGTQNNFVRALQIIYNKRVDGVYSENILPKKYLFLTKDDYNFFINKYLNA